MVGLQALRSVNSRTSEPGIYEIYLNRFKTNIMRAKAFRNSKRIQWSDHRTYSY